MKAAFFNPYLDTLGGGERYTLTLAKSVSDLGYSVDLQWPVKSIKKKLEQRFGIPLSKINFVADVKKGYGYDVCFWVSDGSIPTLGARKNILHFQVPFHDVNGSSLLNKMKLFRINKIVVNSMFTKKFIDKEYGVNSIVIYPPVDTLQIKSKRKENFILSVARFSRLLQNKRQDILIKAFKDLVDLGVKDWKLVLAGGVEVGSKNLLDEIKKTIDGYPIEILESPDFTKLKEYYGKAKIFWSATGFEVDEDINPEKVEHFGITTVESMSGGCVPLVFNAGGHKEIISSGINGYLWNSPKELVQATFELIKNKNKIVEFSKHAKLSSAKYSFLRFQDEYKHLVQ